LPLLNFQPSYESRASFALSVRSALFWESTRRRMVQIYSSWTVWTLKMRPIDCLASVTRNCNSTLRKMPKERISQLWVNTVPNKWHYSQLAAQIQIREPLFNEEECVEKDDLVKAEYL